MRKGKKWFSVIDKWPLLYQRVLARAVYADGSEEVVIAYLVRVGESRLEWSGAELGSKTVTHWQPLPEFWV